MQVTPSDAVLYAHQQSPCPPHLIPPSTHLLDFSCFFPVKNLLFNQSPAAVSSRLVQSAHCIFATACAVKINSDILPLTRTGSRCQILTRGARVSVCLYPLLTHKELQQHKLSCTLSPSAQPFVKKNCDETKVRITAEASKNTPELQVCGHGSGTRSTPAWHHFGSASGQFMAVPWPKRTRGHTAYGPAVQKPCQMFFRKTQPYKIIPQKTATNT